MEILKKIFKPAVLTSVGLIIVALGLMKLYPMGDWFMRLGAGLIIVGSVWYFFYNN